MAFQVVTYQSAQAFLARGKSWLLQSEGENNLILGIVLRMAENDDFAPSDMLVTIESDGYVAGCAFRTLPYNLGLSRLPLKAVPVLVDHVATRYDTLPGVLGPREEARYFSRVWCGPRALSFRPIMDQRIYQLDELIAPGREIEGSLRVATPADRSLVVEWLRRFFDDTNMPVRNSEDLADTMLPEGSLFIWVVNGQDVSMAGVTGRTPNGARIGFVYTPPEHRRNGYGTAITAELTRKMLAQGKRFCFLFTDVSNPTSNHIYQALGYRPVADIVDYQFF